MKSLHVVLMGSLLAVVLCAGLAEAGNANWARNAEPDMAGYNIYVCLSPGCTASKTPAMKQGGMVPQSAVGSRPSWTLPTGLEGGFSVTAVDLSGNESGATVSVPFDQKAPATPSDVQTN